MPISSRPLEDHGLSPESNSEGISGRTSPKGCFSDPNVDKQIVVGISRLQARILEAYAECTISNLDDFLVGTLVESVDIHASAYFTKITDERLVPEYIMYLRKVGAALFHNAEEHSHLQDPYSEKRLRKLAKNTGSLNARKFQLSEQQYEQELQKLIEEIRSAVRPEAVAWHTWKSQIDARIFSRFEARYLYWYAEANSRLSISSERDQAQPFGNSVSESRIQLPIGQSTKI